MFIAKSRVLLDKDGNCVKADDPKGVQVLAGFKGAKVSEKIIGNVKGAEEFFDADNLSKQPGHSGPKTVLTAHDAPPPKPHGTGGFSSKK